MWRRLLPEALELLAAAQAGCASRDQLRTHGVGPDLVARRVAAGTWQVAGTSAVVPHSGPLGADGRRWCAVLGTGGVLAGLSALAVHGLRSWERDVVDVVVPRSAARTGQEGVRRRTSSRWDPADRTTRGGLPLHRVERAALDAAGRSPSARTAGGLVAAVVQQRLTTAERLLDAARGTTALRHRTEVLAVLGDVAGGSHAMTEVDLVRLCRRGRLPLPRRQARRTDAGGRVRYLDAEWVRADGRWVLLEVDGVGHLDESRWYDDLMRAAEVGSGDDLVVRLPARALRVEPERVLALLRRLLT